MYDHRQILWETSQYTILRYEFTKLFRSEGLGWDMIPLEIKNINSLQKFKIEIKKWPPENYSCFLCRPYMQNLGFIDLI